LSISVFKEFWENFGWNCVESIDPFERNWSHEALGILINISFLAFEPKAQSLKRPTGIVWILNVLQSPIEWRLDPWPVALLGGGGSFRRWGLVGGSELIWGVTLKRLQGPHSLLSVFSPPWGNQL
jgi:hypothetical protein